MVKENEIKVRVDVGFAEAKPADAYRQYRGEITFIGKDKNGREYLGKKGFDYSMYNGYEGIVVNFDMIFRQKIPESEDAIEEDIKRAEEGIELKLKDAEDNPVIVENPDIRRLLRTVSLETALGLYGAGMANHSWADYDIKRDYSGLEDFLEQYRK